MTGLPSVACWRQSGPVSPKCLKQKQVSASNQRTHTILGKSPRDLCAVPLADYRLLGVGFPRRPAPLRGKPQASRQAQNLRCLVTATLPTKLGGLLKTPLRWSRIRAAISWPLHHRVAISNHRLVSFTHGQVTFRWRDSADNNKQKLLPLPVDEFLSRFLLHLLPQGFVRIRHFGFLASRRRAKLLPLCFQLLGAAQQPPCEEHTSSTEDSPDLYHCPNCGGPMKVIERLTAAEIQLRSLPRISAAA